MVTDQFSRRLLKEAGVNPDRLGLDWASAAEAPLYVELITKFTDKIMAMGPLGELEGVPLNRLKRRLAVARSAASSVKLRTRFGRLTRELREKNDYSSRFIQARMSENLDEAILREMEQLEENI
jgi:F420-non-reducing hydrogenase iron-sulfur subunit